MARRYDSDYQCLISKLNDAFSDSKNEKAANLTVFHNVVPEKQKLIEEMPYEELRKIQGKIRSGVEDIAYLTEKEKEMLEEINGFRSLNYKLVVWHMTGTINMQQIMSDYSKFMQKNEVFRTVYLHKGLEEPVRVVYQNREKNFPIHDLKNMNRDTQSFLIKNVLAAEARREYNIESDSSFRIQGYLISGNEILVVISIYPYLPYPMGIREMMYRIFDGMKHKSNAHNVDEKTIRKMNEELRQKNINYWKELLLPLGKSLTIPGESKSIGDKKKRRSEKVFLYKELGEELTGKILEFCKKNSISVKAVFLCAWAELLGRYHDEKNPVMLVAYKGEKMNVLPVKIVREEKKHPNMLEVDKQLKRSSNNSNCTIHDIESAAGISFSEYFRVLHSFIEFGEQTDIEREKKSSKSVNTIHTDDVDINLHINYQIFDKNMIVNAVSKEGIPEIVLENLYDLFLEEVSMILEPDGAKFDKKSFLKIDDSDEEKLYKIQIAQTALYLKNAGIFESIKVEEIMKLAEYCRLKTYFFGDNVVSEKCRLSKLYILGDGKIEESRMNEEGMVKSLRILKQGSLFGVESLFDRGEASTTYTVISSQAKLVEIDKEIFAEVFRKKPEGWIALLEKEYDQKDKLQRLWMTV